jgi:septal ring factor EnvC (AmiA/AmiB activator)
MPDWFVTLVSAVLSFASAVAVGVLVYRSTRKGDTTTAVLTERRDTIADRDSLINQLQEDISSLKTDMASQKAETAELRSEVQQVREHNNALIRYCYRLIDILRSVGHGDRIPDPPPHGIHL